MITPNQVLEAAKALKASEGTLTEDVTNLDVSGVIQPALLDTWRAIAQDIGKSGIGAMQVLDRLDQKVDLSKADDELTGEVRIRITKQPTATTFYFFTSPGLSALLSSVDLIPTARRILVAGDFAPFGTDSCSIQPWSEN